MAQRLSCLLFFPFCVCLSSAPPPPPPPHPLSFFWVLTPLPPPPTPPPSPPSPPHTPSCFSSPFLLSSSFLSFFFSLIFFSLFVVSRDNYSATTRRFKNSSPSPLSSSSPDRLVGLVVKASASRAEGPGFESRLCRDFFGVESYQ